MDFDLPGRIKNTRLLYSNALLPLFEAVINSIHAVDETPKSDGGAIHIHIERDHTQEPLSFEAPLRALSLPIRSILISDNGIGFTELHFKSFSTADSQHKASLGGKGIGRFVWLKAFDHAEIQSTFKESDGKTYRRTFSLRLTPKGVEDHSKVECDTHEAHMTTVKLCDFKSEYQREAPHSAETVARRIVEHCLEHFVLGLAPGIFVHDDDSGELHDLYQMFEEEVKGTSTVEAFRIGERQFQLHNLRMSPSYQSSHRLHFCAHNRSVASENLSGKIPNLTGSLKDSDGKPFVYSGYISGKYFDDCVNSERSDFVIPKEDSVTGMPGWQTILQKSVDAASAFVSTYTKTIKSTKEQQIVEFVRSKAPEYRPVVKHRKEFLDRIPPDLPEEKLDLELYKINQEYEAELRQESSVMLSSLQRGPEDWETFKEKYATFLEEWNESGIAKLARHVVHRKATLDFLRTSLKVTPSGKYQLESAIHQIVFPLKKTSDDVLPDQMNLWILDEKLTYHYYLASDLPFNKLDIRIPSRERADILIFNGPSAFVSEGPPFSSVVLIEFKRPLRDDYTDEENPITQIYRYAELIKGGTAVDRGGRPISINAETPFYAYLVCDLTLTLKTQAKYASLAATPDGMGFFGYNKELGVYIEIMSFDKLVTEAERRNAKHFEQLNLPRA
ncbi:MAG TPA: ATP-binding protein [Candidatus Limnocylindrales bacterium]|nr:ATP-binding protein [Candidatus Limnocylindrales bacterium]